MLSTMLFYDLRMGSGFLVMPFTRSSVCPLSVPSIQNMFSRSLLEMVQHRRTLTMKISLALGLLSSRLMMLQYWYVQRFLHGCSSTMPTWIPHTMVLRLQLLVLLYLPVLLALLIRILFWKRSSKILPQLLCDSAKFKFRAISLCLCHLCPQKHRKLSITSDLERTFPPPTS